VIAAGVCWATYPFLRTSPQSDCESEGFFHSPPIFQ
jgi:hypothetical protein